MDLQQAVKINRQILRLMQSKYDQFFPGAYNTPEARYYKLLERDTFQAEEALKHGGLTLLPDEDEGRIVEKHGP